MKTRFVDSWFDLMSLLFMLWSRNLASKQYNFLNEFRKHEMLMLCIDDHVQCSTQNQVKKVQYPKACTCLTLIWGWFYMSIFKVILSLDCLSLKVTFFQNFDLRSPLSVILTIPGRTECWCCYIYNWCQDPSFRRKLRPCKSC